LIVPSAAWGQSSYIWNGGGSDNNWSTGGNWEGSSGPSSPQAYLNFAGSTTVTSNNDLANYGPGFQIYFNSGAGAYTLTGNAINFYDYSGTSPLIENDSSNQQTIEIQVDVEYNMNIIANTGDLLFTGSGIYIDNSSYLNFTANAGETITVSGTINQATDGITIGGNIGSSTGGGTVIFAANNAYTGGDTMIYGGTLQIGNGGTTGSISSTNLVFDVGIGTSASSGTLAINRTDSPTISNNISMSSANTWANIAVATGDTATLSGSITGAGEFWTTGAGTLVITPNSGSASRSASNVISTGTLQIQDFSPSTLGTGNFYIVNGALNYTGPSTSTSRLGAYALLSATSTIGVTNSGTNLTLTNDLGGHSGGALTKTGSGTLTLSAGNTYNGGTTISNGILVLGTGGSLYSSGAVQVNSTFDISQAGSQTIGDLSGSGTVALGSSGLTVGTANSTTFSGSITDGGIGGGTGGSLVKQGIGTLTLTAANAYSGGTIISGGTALANNSTGSGTGSGNVTINSGGTLGGSGTIAASSGNSILVASGGDITPGSAPVGSVAQNFLSITAPSAATPVLTFDAPSGATLNVPQMTFNLGSGAAPSDNSGLTFSGSSSYIKLTANVPGEVLFNDNPIQINDLTNGVLAAKGDYLLFQGQANSDYSGLTVTASGQITAGLFVEDPTTAIGDLFLQNGDILVELNPNVSGYVGGTFTYLPSVSATAGYTATNLPSWLSIDASTGLLSGIATAAGTYNVTIIANNELGASTALPVTININSAPTGAPYITSPLQISASADLKYQITATNSPTTFSAADLPNGMVLTPSGGDIEGSGSTPNGTYSVQITATNAIGSDTENLVITVNTTATPNTLTMLHNFGDGSVANDGTSPSSLIDTTEGIYGVTSGGGNSGAGTIFNSTSSESNVFESLAGAYGINPVGLIQGSDGNFYGASSTGGSANQGAIFQITPAGVINVLHSFGDGTVMNDGAYPAASLVQGPDGNFYGTTQSGGAANLGAIFAMTSTGSVTTLHSFGDGSVLNDGSNPLAALIFVPDGTFYLGSDGNYYPDGSYYGTTRNGGRNGLGMIFAMNTQGLVSNVHNFGDVANDGAYPMAALVQRTYTSTLDEYKIPTLDGNLYGSTYGGGTAGNGTLFCISPEGGTYSIIHSFGDGSVSGDGANPQSPLTLKGSVLFGSTTYGGSANAGTIFSLNPGAPFTLVAPTLLYTFGLESPDGANPTSNLYVDGNNDVYGTTLSGGTSGSGILYVLGMYANYSVSSVHQKAPGVVFQVGTGSLPDGMDVDGDAAPVGTPYSSDPLGVYTWTVVETVEPGGEVISTMSFTMVLGAYSSITTTALPGGTIGSRYSLQLAASNTPTSFSATGLPPGLTCSSSGLIIGTPTSAGAYSVAISATNSIGQGASTTLTLNVTASTPASPATTDTPTMPQWALSLLALLLLAAGSNVLSKSAAENTFTLGSD
jgi:uncharacterized repeat protein (TIGR03803 family)/autotransporter-associated beta strand protein